MFVVDDTTQLSDVVGVPRLTPMAVQLLCVVKVVIFAGHVMSGWTVSNTVTVCTQVLLLPELSVTIHVTVVGPCGYVVDG